MEINVSSEGPLSARQHYKLPDEGPSLETSIFTLKFVVSDIVK